MKSVFAVLAIAILAGAATYPRLEIDPSSPSVGDDVTLWVIKGKHADGCVPSYNASYTIETSPLRIYPPIKTIHLSYTEEWPGSDVMCIQVPTEYGPKITLSDIAAGSYTLMDGDEAVGTFQVTDQAVPAAYSITGRVTDDPYPTKRMEFPIEGAKVYLREQLMWALDVSGGTAPIVVPAGVTVDSAITGTDGSYKFSSVAPNLYTLQFVASGYITRQVSLGLSSDTTISVKLLAQGASATVSGTVTEKQFCPEGLDCMMALMPIEGCTVTVWSECTDLYPVPYSSGPVVQGGGVSAAELAPVMCPSYTAITDKQGSYTVAGIPLTTNGAAVIVTARAPGYASETSREKIYNSITTTVDFALESSYGNRDTVDRDGMVYSVATERRIYTRYDALKTTYVIDNQSTTTVTFGGVGEQSPCTYAMLLIGESGDTVYNSSSGIACPAIYTEWQLAPGEKTEYDFPAYALNVPAGTYTVVARRVAEPATAVSVEITVEAYLTDAVRKTRAAPQGSRVWYDARRGALGLDLTRQQRVRVSAFLPNGRMVPELSFDRHLAPGRHTVETGQSRANAGILLVRVVGEDFTATRTIKMAR